VRFGALRILRCASNLVVRSESSDTDLHASPEVGHSYL
jgi:hypothetical protein